MNSFFTGSYSNDSKEIIADKLKDLLDSIDDGAYFGAIGSSFNPFEDHKRHAIALVKSEGSYFLFDPNYGTLTLNKNKFLKLLCHIIKPAQAINRNNNYWFFALSQFELSTQN